MIMRWLSSQDLLFWLISNIVLAFLVPIVSYLIGLSMTEGILVLITVFVWNVSLFFDVVEAGR